MSQNGVKIIKRGRISKEIIVVCFVSQILTALYILKDNRYTIVSIWLGQGGWVGWE